MLYSLSTFPDEILALIIGHVDDLSCLAFLARTSKHFYELALPHLYADISLRGPEGYFSNEGLQYFRPLALSLLQTPRLASLVHTFTIRGRYSTSHKQGPIEKQPPELETFLRSKISIRSTQKAKFEEGPTAHGTATHSNGENVVSAKAEQWFRHVRAGFNDAALLALLLPELVNLQSMDISFSPGREDELSDRPSNPEFVENMLEQAQSNQVCRRAYELSMFSNLKDVLVCSAVGM